MTHIEIMTLLRRATKLLSPLIFATILASSLAVAAAPKSNQKTDNAKSARQKEAEPSILQGIHVLGDRPAPFALDAHAALLVAAHSGAVLYAYNEHVKMQPASLAKIMTFYISLEALKNGKIKLDTPIPISEKAWRLSIDKTVSKMFLEVGQQVPVKDLFYGLMVSSGNDAATALAEYLAGSTDAFVTMMNDQAKALGLKETHFSSPDGLPEPDQYTTAFDMVKLARAVIEYHPEAFNYTAVKQYTFHNIEQRNWNTLLFYDSRVNGLKTGHVAEAGFHLVATAHTDDLDLVSAVMGAPNAEKRRTETEKLLDWAFRTFTTVKLDWHPAIPSEVPVYEGAAATVPIGPAGLGAITVSKGDEQKIKVSGHVDAPYLVAPVAKGVKVGELQVTQSGKTISTLRVETQSRVERGGFMHVLIDKLRLSMRRVGRGIKSLLGSLWRKIPILGH